MVDAAARKDFLKGKEVSFTGRLASMTRGEAVELITAYGGRFMPVPREGTAFLILGEDGWPLQSDGRLTRKLRRAQRLKEEGRPISILPEEEFLELLGLAERKADIHRSYTVSQLARILKVPGSRIRRWVRSGLIRPVNEVQRLSYFDFRQVACARALNDLLSSGITTQRLRSSFEALSRWMGEVGSPLLQLSVLEGTRQICARLENGQLVEPNGQLHFDFWEAGRSSPVHLERNPSTLEEWLDVALGHEEEGCLVEAEAAYKKAILCLGKMPELCFNLGNVLYARGENAEAIESFREAVGADPHYVEAWNNLGIVLGELEKWREAIEAFERALYLSPRYADAHYNLAETLLQMGEAGAARPHWEAYLRQDSRSSWARKARERLMGIQV